jgi:hypothetical protein
MIQESAFKPPHPLRTAVLFLVFNRLDTTKQVFQAICQAKPPRLYVAADGGRADKVGEADKVQAVRDYIMQNIDWDCKVKTLFREQNLGCKYAVSGAITWFFENEEQGIILEDDCLPSQSFFWFCEELLEKYKDDERIMMISGYNKQQRYDVGNDYFYSNIGGIWGWASWKRSWQLYDVDLNNIIDSEFYKLHFLLGKVIYKKRLNHYDALRNGLDTWDYQWSFCRHFNSGLSCVPSVSLIQNIGFGEGATHTDTGYDSVVSLELELPVKENKVVIADSKYDELIHHKPGFAKRLKNKLERIYDGFFKK